MAAVTKTVAGKDFFLWWDNVLVGCSNSATINFTAEQLEATCKSSEGWTEQIPGKKGWNVSLEGVYKVYATADQATNVSVADFFDKLSEDTRGTVKVGTTEAGDPQWSGDVYVTSVEITGAADGLTTYTISLVGYGEPSMTTVSA
jgi:predicted secreted protein